MPTSGLRSKERCALDTPSFSPLSLSWRARLGGRRDATQGPTPVTVQPAVGVKPPGIPVCVASAGVAKGAERAPPLMSVDLGGHVLQSGSREEGDLRGDG